jgi:hypothetical protein
MRCGSCRSFAAAFFFSPQVVHLHACRTEPASPRLGVGIAACLRGRMGRDTACQRTASSARRSVSNAEAKPGRHPLQTFLKSSSQSGVRRLLPAEQVVGFGSGRTRDQELATIRDSNIWCIFVAISPSDSIFLRVGRTTSKPGNKTVELPPRKALRIVKRSPDRDDDFMDDIRDTDSNLSLCEENARLRHLVVELSTMVLRCIAVEK